MKFEMSVCDGSSWKLVSELNPLTIDIICKWMSEAYTVSTSYSNTFCINITGSRIRIKSKEFETEISNDDYLIKGTMRLSLINELQIFLRKLATYKESKAGRKPSNDSNRQKIIDFFNNAAAGDYNYNSISKATNISEHLIRNLMPSLFRDMGLNYKILNKKMIYTKRGGEMK